MKNNLLGLIAAVAFGFSVSTVAAPTAITGAVITGGTAGACTVLGEDVKVNLSKGVKGSYDCFEGTNSINIGACHEAGSRSNQLVCAQTGINGQGAATYNNAACNDDNVGDTITLSAGLSYRGYRASTTGGSVATQSLSAACTDGTVQELVNQQQ
ncbi:hypothetical protein [Pseudomonas sp. 8O]|uniref:hypothetical protein n=1 Tax=Pseudomonas sp. 8O TaxID=2653165 RepID=UPI0012F37918|nr:hypothetical protein [Pseudomonas sp. 8O]VXB19015.1 conserved exported hypothetical protein [Pseudomonas sp. 8O]